MAACPWVQGHQALYLYKQRIEPGPASITGILQTGANSDVSHNNIQYSISVCNTLENINSVVHNHMFSTTGF
jgi:hypothetical protein